MDFYTDDSPIIACSTGLIANTAISVIRISGFKNISDFQKVFSKNLSKVQPRTSYRSHLLDNSNSIDDILFVYYPAPHSYTGENILELNVHGNLLNVKNIISLFIKLFNLKDAHPGEFTYRALKNKKISLSQVEGLDLFLNATNPLALSQGKSLLYGELNSEFIKLHESFLKLKSALEFHFDFLEDIGEENAQKIFKEALSELNSKIYSLHTRSTLNSSNLLTPEIILFGEPNAGKSSLFNNLLGMKRSIVSSLAGTTRDFISEFVEFDNIQFKIVDTAGLRKVTSDEIEVEGMKLASEKLNKSFFNILVFNPFLSFDPYYLNHYSIDLVIATHCDQPDFDSKFAPIEPLIRNIPLLKINSLSGPIEPQIKPYILNKYNLLSIENPILIDRQRSIINKIYELSCDFNNLCKNENDLAIIAQELNIIGNNLEELIGIVPAESVLNNIFSNFCIGK